MAWTILSVLSVLSVVGCATALLAGGFAVAALLIATTIVVLTGLTGEPRRRGEPPRGRGADGVTEAGSAALATAANG